MADPRLELEEIRGSIDETQYVDITKKDCDSLSDKQPSVPSVKSELGPIIAKLSNL